MSTPMRGKGIDVEGEASSPKNFRWSQILEDTLLDLLIREVEKGNSPGLTFTSTAYKNVVIDFNRIHGTNIAKKHVLPRIKTMEANFVLFHKAFNGLSGFAWNHEMNKFEAEDHVWAERIEVDPELSRLRGKSIHNWDKLYCFWSNSRATGDQYAGLHETSKRLQRDLDFANLGLNDTNKASNEYPADDASTYRDQASTICAADLPTPMYSWSQKSGGSSLFGKKRNAALISTMEDDYKDMAASIRELSAALVDFGQTIACSKPGPSQNSKIYSILEDLGLEEDYILRSYCYLCSMPTKVALFIGASQAMWGRLLTHIIRSAR